MRMNSDWYNFSEYPFEHPNYDPKNQKIIGKMKEEMKGIILEEFVGLLCRGSVKHNVNQDTDYHHSSSSNGVKKEVKKTHLSR